MLFILCFYRNHRKAQKITPTPHETPDPNHPPLPTLFPTPPLPISMETAKYQGAKPGAPLATETAPGPGAGPMGDTGVSPSSPILWG